MYLQLLTSTLALFSAVNGRSILSTGSATKAADPFVGYLISTFSDPNPRVQFHLSNGNNPGSYKFLNGGKEVLTSEVGTKAVRDIYLTTNDARDVWYIIATGERHCLITLSILINAYHRSRRFCPRLLMGRSKPPRKPWSGRLEV
jgi:hypothetical protein